MLTGRKIIMDLNKIKQSDFAFLVSPRRFSDTRGFFAETWNNVEARKNGISHDFVQDNHSMSYEVGTVRGLHFQSPPHAQAKLVRCGRGRLFDVAVDIRQGSPTYCNWIGEELSFENGKQLYIPEGFLHGFITLEPNTEIVYKCSDYYAPECDGSIRFDDPEIAIEWPIDISNVILSEKDAAAPLMQDIKNPFYF